MTFAFAPNIGPIITVEKLVLMVQGGYQPVPESVTQFNDLQQLLQSLNSTFAPAPAIGVLPDRSQTTPLHWTLPWAR